MAGRHIGEVARLLQVPVETIRYYERCGLLGKPKRTGSNYRLYSDEQLEQLGFVLNCRNLDMTHQEIRRLLSVRDRRPTDCAEINALIEEHIEHIEQRITELRALSEELRALRTSCKEIRSVDDCKIIGTLRRTPAAKAVSSHLSTHKDAPNRKRRIAS